MPTVTRGSSRMSQVRRRRTSPWPWIAIGVQVLAAASVQGTAPGARDPPRLRHVEEAPALGAAFEIVEKPRVSLARGLQSGVCYPPLLKLLVPLTFRNYELCVLQKEDSLDMTIPGQDWHIRAQCWCDHNMKDAVNDFNCCGHEEYSLLCEINCSPDCSTPAATTCLENCPSLCLERDYAPETCACAENNCGEHILCITAQGRNRTASGQLAPVCDDYGFQASSQYQAYHACMSNHPRRTNWHRHNAQKYCYCQAGLRAAAVANSCCGAIWASTVCAADCQSLVQCQSAPGVQCQNDCISTCPSIQPAMVSQTCVDMCIDSNGACAEYDSCEPGGHPTFEYLCDDGSATDNNGCCQARLANGLMGATCPTLCESGIRYIFNHGTECQCFGCPVSNQEASESLKVALEQNVWDNGQLILTDISRNVGLVLGPNRRMQELIALRNDEINAAIAEHNWDGTSPNAVLQNQINAINDRYIQQINDEAAQYKLNGETTTPIPTLASSGGDDGDSNMGLILGCVIAGAIVVILGAAVVVWKTMAQKKGARSQAGGDSSFSPYDHDANVVVGRPVGADSAEAVSGAPVAENAEKGTGSNAAKDETECEL